MLQMWVGRKVRLRAMRPDDWDILAPLYADSEMERLGFGTHYPRSAERLRRRLEKEIDEDKDEGDEAWLIIETLAEARVVGFVGLKHMDLRHRVAELGIALHDRTAWGQGYGSEAMRLLLRYAFRELGLEKINLTVFEQNTRAIRLYEHLGFQHEARRRSQAYTAGRRWDDLWMGLTRAEYEAQHAAWFPADTWPRDPADA